MLKKYKNLFPLHYISYWNLKYFLHRLSKLRLLPSKEKYISLRKNNEYFDNQISLFIGCENENDIFSLNFPYPLNINKITMYIKENKISQTVFEVSFLKKIINPEYYDDFDKDMIAKQQGRDMQIKIKEKNPIIILGENNIVKFNLVNGNHRIIQAIRDKKECVQGYLVPASICKDCGLTNDYKKLYVLVENLYKRLYGVLK